LGFYVPPTVVYDALPEKKKEHQFRMWVKLQLDFYPMNKVNTLLYKLFSPKHKIIRNIKYISLVILV
jgi:hypothetical protein